jgi:hypothetical protein
MDIALCSGPNDGVVAEDEAEDDDCNADDDEGVRGAARIDRPDTAGECGGGMAGC